MKAATPAHLSPDQIKRLAKVRRLAWLLDKSIKIPGVNFRIGLEGLIGMIPGIGDIVGGALSAYLIYHAHKAGVSGNAKAKMAGYALLETVAGSVPVVGDLFDFAFKANVRIADLLEKELGAPREIEKAEKPPA